MNHPDDAYSMGGDIGRRLSRVIGSSVAMLDGDAFRQRRKLIAPRFGARRIAAMADGIVDEFVKRIEMWAQYAERGVTIDLQHEIAKVTLPSFLRAMFSISVPDREIRDLDVDLRIILRAAAAVCFICAPPRLMPTRGAESFPKSWLRLRKWISRLIDDRLESSVDRDDLLQTLLDAKRGDAATIRQRDLIQETAMLIAGGYETVVAALSWTLALLNANCDARVRLYEEVDALDAVRPSSEDLNKLTWAKACFDEGQRLQGHPLNPRFATRDDWVGGYFIPRGTLIGIPMYTVHRDSRWWPDPDIYDPNRFVDSQVIHARPSASFIPFGLGPHRCIGSALGYMNAQFLLVLIHQRYRLHFPPNWQPRHSPKFSSSVDGGLPVTLTLRR